MTKQSFGVVPWAYINKKWYFLAQISYSSTKYDLKIDPLRGQQKENEEGHETAAREAMEESAYTLDFTKVPASKFGKPLEGLYHVCCWFPNNVNVMEIYDANRTHLVGGEDKEIAKSVKECSGLVWVEASEDVVEKASQKEPVLVEGYRLALQIMEMLADENLESTRAKAPNFSFDYPEDSDLTSFIAIDQIDGAENSETLLERRTSLMDENTLIQCHENHLAMYPEDEPRMRRVLARKKSTQKDGDRKKPSKLGK